MKWTPKKEYEVRYRHWKRGLKSERTMKVTAKTRSHAERVFLSSMPADRVAILSIYPVMSESERTARKMARFFKGA